MKLLPIYVLSLLILSPYGCSGVSDQATRSKPALKKPEQPPRYKLKSSHTPPAPKEESLTEEEFEMIFDGNINLRSDLSKKQKYRYATGVWLSVRTIPGPLNSDHKNKKKLFPIINGILVIRGLKPLEYSCDFVDKDGNKITNLILDFSSIDPGVVHQANPEIIY
jgi:hypothetical protein